MTRATCEQARRIDVRVLERHGALRHGAFSTSASSGASVRLWAAADHLVVCASPREGLAGQRIRYTWTDQRLGGRRRWFECPDCSSRCAVIFETGGRFTCRSCSGLSYQSQREAPHWRLLEQAQKIREQLGGSRNLTLPFPAKPKGMHIATYDRLRQRAEIKEHIGLVTLSAVTQAARARLGRAADRG